jgi:hypothetical protein
MDPGQTFVHGKDRETAQILLAACDKAGVDQSLVRTVGHGFLVPDEVWDAVATPDPPPGGEF